MVAQVQSGGIPPCGIGGSQDQSGPCTGSYGQPSDAGKGVFDSVSSSGVSSALIAAGVVVAVVLFAAWLSRAVARFFRGQQSVGGLGDDFWREAGKAWDGKAVQSSSQRPGTALAVSSGESRGLD